MTGTTPKPALRKIVEATRQVESAIALLRDARDIVYEQTNGSTVSGAPDLDAALYNLVGDDPDPAAEPVLGHLRAILTMNRSASQVW